MRIAARRPAVLLVLSLVALAALPASPSLAAGTVRVEAESYAAQRGTWISPAPYPSGGLLVDGVSHGDWLRYDGVTADRVRHTLVCFTSNAPRGTDTATLAVHLGSPWTAPAMTIAVRTNIGGGQKELAFGGQLPDGVHTVYLRVTQPRGVAHFALDYLLLSEFAPPPSLNCF
jgi:hypothetical protein